MESKIVSGVGIASIRGFKGPGGREIEAAMIGEVKKCVEEGISIDRDPDLVLTRMLNARQDVIDDRDR